MSPIIRGYQVEQTNIITTNKIIKNTYMLLSMTLIFSAITAYLSMLINTQPMGYMTVFVYIALLFLTNIFRNSILGILFVFMLTGFMGYTLAPILNIILYGFINGAQIITVSLGLTGIIFFTLSIYALTSQKDFSFLSSFLFIGLIVIIFASLIGLFTKFPILHLMISSFFVLISAGYILYETSNIIHGGETNYITATVSLYINIFNIFVSLLHIISFFSGRRN